MAETQQALHVEVYKTIFETWRSEVDSYWQRNSYFAAFETAALAACWYVIEHSHVWSGLAFSILGFVSALIWLITSFAVHSYVSYWWRCVKKVESTLLLTHEKLDFANEHPGSGLHPSTLIHVIPILFMTAWLVIFIFACRSLWICYACGVQPKG